MGFFELKDYVERGIKLGRNVDKWIVELHFKLSFPLTNFIIVLFGAPLASHIRRTGKAVEFGIGLFICFLYYSTIRSGQALGWNGSLNPILAAWTGNVIFGALGVLLLLKAHK